jgi:hypothetical protein
LSGQLDTLDAVVARAMELPVQAPDLGMRPERIAAMTGWLLAFLMRYFITEHLEELAPGPRGGFIIDTELAAAMRTRSDDGRLPHLLP